MPRFRKPNHCPHAMHEGESEPPAEQQHNEDNQQQSTAPDAVTVRVVPTEPPTDCEHNQHDQHNGEQIHGIP